MRKWKPARAAVATGLVGLLTATAPALAQSTPEARCAALAGARLDNVTITRAEMQPASQIVPGAFMPDFTGVGKGPPISGLPAFCRIAGSIRPEAGSDIRFEVWMPREGWNGRFSGIGIGGFAGMINHWELGAALKAGQATAATDTGHEGFGMESAWAKGNPQKVRDYAWRGIHLMTVNAKRLIADFYGRPAYKSYFMSCSGGGRQALMQASRFPEDYDGLVAGAPAARMTDLVMAMIWTLQAQMPPGAALRPEQAGLIDDEVVRQCDALDGQADRSIADPRQCRVDFSRLACGVSSSPQCLSPAQVTALQMIARGPQDRRGRTIVPPYSFTASVRGAPVPQSGWEGWIFTGGKSPPSSTFFARGTLADFFDQPFADVASFDWNRDPARLRAALSADLDPKPDMRRFFARGGKLVIWHGWSDPAIPAGMAINYYNDILRASGPRAKQSVRLFMVPEMQHCFAGNGASAFGHMGAQSQTDSPERHIGMAVQQWVESGRVPESIIGSKGTSPMDAASLTRPQRLHCAWPRKARLRAGADPDKAASYDCA
jgi:feruloyl esterase